MLRKKNFIKHHYFNKLDIQEKMCISAMLCLSFMKGICIGMYLNKK